MEAYVDGLPIPRASSSRTSVASEYRALGSVKCCSARILLSETFSSTIRDRLEREAAGSLKVISVEEKPRRRNPSAPFTTSTLQQEASRKLGFGARRTMRVAQHLYEGVDLDGSRVGLITYMRTDSVNIAAEAVSEIRELIAQRYGVNNLPKSTNLYKSKARNAQEAHEAMLPVAR